ncbi:MAG: hypothetical protein A2430_02215 [Candidatus Liptonbacteria bacterium RIFOXYC1_FULL_36_8]|uniref:Glutamyl-tRNA amidotransferase n=3 Tax=Candidatus Liptoniibacteriota TaxID=1817909 RepID=A0A1G2CPT3_9BACT|nr:MAG: hypothetical protein A2390_00230 [Candidatus Liptonbacteria bacterium RIFOXYB1_FULL_36_10]OGZ03966.1 MAG: hypothetical protein A2430_02215 [Candidatus Liptonbacteria bacterium RIFOXYC1_FULL_36_8]OGZ04373.1 MAG: hypothetical protein A2604_01710 [Candidatus Liptonbacteria bacterium RIFOXYD1_FULL_36_11]
MEEGLLFKINQDIKEALKGGDSFRLGVLRMVMASLKNLEIENRGKGKDVGEEDAIALLRREQKKRKEAAEVFLSGGRNDLAEKEKKEVEIISVYLPKEMEQKEIEEVVLKIVKGGGDFGVVMKEVMKELKGKADGKLVAEIIKEKLEK